MCKWRPSNIKITMPSTATVGDKIRAIVDVRNPEQTTSQYFFGKIYFEAPKGIEIPAYHIVNKGDGGKFVLNDICLNTKGIFRIKAFFKKGPITGDRNPIRVTDKH